MPVEFTITDATESDAEGIRDLAVSIWNRCYPGIITREQIDYMLGWMYSPDRIRTEIGEGGIVYLLVNDEAEGSLIGFAAFGPGDVKGECFIHKLYIAPVVQGRGIGTAVIGEIERRARAMQANRLSLRVNRNNHQAIGAYEKSGFVNSESICSDIGGGHVMDDFVMVKSLS